MLFDLPHLEGSDLSRVPLIERKQLLQKLLAHASKHLSISSHAVGNGDAAFAMALDEQLEGIVSKRIHSAYHAGRGDDWLKIKRLESDEFAVVGYTTPKGTRHGLGSLLLARPDPAVASGWIYAGRVGTGFSDEQLRSVAASLAGKGSRKPTVKLVAVDPLLRDAHWVTPKAVVEVYYRGIGNHNLLRQPSLKTMRTDKFADDLADSDRSSTKRPGNAAGLVPGAAAMAITHPDRVVFPDDGYTKQDVADYYTSVMKWFLPGIVDRPMSVIRCPEGIAKACFFQKHMIQGLQYIGSKKLKEETGAQATYIYPVDADSVIELVQFGALEFHPWGATIARPNKADRLVFDLDPGPDVAWDRVIAAARLLRKLLAQIGLESFLRTTGGKGLHVVVPLNPACAWPQAKAFAQVFAETLARVHPLEFVATASKAKRCGKIYVDYLRNSRGATSVASYSLRARTGAPVAMPLRWSELGKLRSGHDFNIRSAPKRLARLRSDPWEGIDTITQSLDGLINRPAE